MSRAEPIFGTWDDLPKNGYSDEISELWHYLAAQKVNTPEMEFNSGLTQRRPEWTMLCDLYRRARPKVVVEIGVAQGGTFAGWCFLGRPDATLIAIDRDLNDCRPRAGEQVNPKIVHRAVDAMTENGGGVHALGRNKQQIVAISGWSYEQPVLEKLRMALSGRTIDFLFHDASHEEEMFDRDFEIYWPMISDGGIFASHDIMKSAHDKCTKSIAWRRIAERNDYSARFEFVGGVNDDSMGIGVLIK